MSAKSSLAVTPQARPAEPPGKDVATRTRHWVPIRTLHAGHRAKVQAHLLALNDEDRATRFGHAISDERIAHYAEQIDFDRDRVFGTFDRRLELLTLAHLALDREHGVAEFGVSVLPRARGRGLGTRLFAHAVMHARNRGVHTLYIHVARDNTQMMAIVQHAGAVIDFEGSDATAELPLPALTLGTQIEELLANQAAAVDFRFKRHALELDALRPGLPPES
ncbi:MAG: N-acetyltransferase [Betaproteobacteria bacterium]|nr:N-acetyltransferase [Betaproteobacteria bacterium]